MDNHYDRQFTGGALPMENKKKLTIDLTVVYLLNLAIILLARLI